MSVINVWNVGNFKIKMSQCVADCGSTTYLALVTLPSALFLFKDVYTKNSCKNYAPYFFGETIPSYFLILKCLLLE